MERITFRAMTGSNGAVGHGAAVKRVEDPVLLRGARPYTDDLREPKDALYAIFVRSGYAHGTITSIDTAEASAAPGVVAVLTDADLKLGVLPSAAPPIPTPRRRCAGRSWRPSACASSASRSPS